MDLKEYSPELIINRYNEKKMTMRSIVEETKRIDPDGKGISIGTVQRIISGSEALPSTICLLCAALDISPKSTYVSRK